MARPINNPYWTSKLVIELAPLETHPSVSQNFRRGVIKKNRYLNISDVNGEDICKKFIDCFLSYYLCCEKVRFKDLTYIKNADSINNMFFFFRICVISRLWLN